MLDLAPFLKENSRLGKYVDMFKSCYIIHVAINDAFTSEFELEVIELAFAMKTCYGIK